MGYIYKITNDVNGKMYIGKTELVNPEKRWKEHLQDCKKERCEKRPLYAAMNKYGEEHFYFEVIEKTDTSDNTCEREQYWINELRTYVGFKDCNGYNATLGGDGKAYLNLDEDEVVRYHIEEAYYMATNTAKHFNVDPQTIRKILVKNNIGWLKNCDSTRMHSYLEHNSIVQVDKNTKFILNRFESKAEANYYMGKDKNNGAIYDACNMRRGHRLAYGYLWYNEKDIPKAIKDGEVIDTGLWLN